VWNETEQTRMVLIVDIWHPDFSEKEIQFLQATLANGDKQAVERGDNLIQRAMESHQGRSNASVFDAL